MRLLILCSNQGGPWSLFITPARPKILQLNGMTCQDFPSIAEALQAAKQLYEDNKAEYEHDEPIQEHANQMLVKYWYVHGEGKKRSWSLSERKEFCLESDVKNKKALTETSERYMELFGGDASSSGLVQIKAENANKVKLDAEVETLRSPWQNSSFLEAAKR